MNRKIVTNSKMNLNGPAPFRAVQLRITRAMSPETKAMIAEKFPHERLLDMSALKREAIPPHSI